jgi:uncharacterized membrane protein YqjE
MNAGGGLFVSVRRVLATLLEIGQLRLELLGTEIELEKLRLFDALLLALAALFGLGVSVVLLCAFVVVLVGQTYRLHALAALIVLFVGASVWGLLAARERLRSPGRLFEASAAELARDRAALLPRD